MQSKDSSMIGVSDYERKERDFYPTPISSTLALFDSDSLYWSADQSAWEPACGDGAMSNVLKTKFKNVFNTDIQPQMEGAEQEDFYTFEPKFNFDWIITNPPYGKEIDKFMKRILVHVEDGKFAAILARNELDSAKSRSKFFRDCPYFMEKRLLLWRPRWIADSTGSPRHNYAWFIWGPSRYQPKITYSFEQKL